MCLWEKCAVFLCQHKVVLTFSAGTHCFQTLIFIFFIYIFQSLFNLLEFQRLVLHYSPPARMQDLPRNQKVRLPPDTHVHRG